LVIMLRPSASRLGRLLPGLAQTWAPCGTRGMVDIPLGRTINRPSPADAPDTDAVLYEVAGGVATITLNQPDNKNALNMELMDGLGDSLAKAQLDDSVRAILLTNNGNTFCAGADLRSKPTRAPRHTLVDVLNDISISPKPVIGRINGHCMGGGVGLAAATDISVVSSEAKLGFTEVRLGVCAAVISVVCLPKLRRADASELFLSGDRISADRATEVGLVNYAVPPSDLDAKVDEIIGNVVRGGPKALAASKELVNKVPMMGREEAFDWTAPLSAAMFKSEEAREGIGAFKERRDAAWVPADRKVGTGRG